MQGALSECPERTMDLGMSITMASTSDLYYIISFLDVKSRDRALGDNIK